MNKAYFIWPLIGLLVFGSFYWHASKGFAERDRQVTIQKEKDRQDRITQDLLRRKKAIEDAIKAQEERKAVRLLRDQKEEEERVARDAMVERRNRAFDDVNKRLRPQVERLKTDADSVREEIKQLDLQKKQYVDEETFLRGFVRTAEINVKTYYDLLEKIKVADEARAIADAVAAKAAKKD
jgi:hypothetical protein